MFTRWSLFGTARTHAFSWWGLYGLMIQDDMLLLVVRNIRHNAKLIIHLYMVY